MAEVGKVTAIIDGDIGPLTSALNQAKGQATAAASGIEGSFKKGFGSGLQGSVSGLTSSMGPLGGAIDGVVGSLGLAGTAAVAGVAGLAALGAASVSTAANWQSLMAGVSKTTGVEGSGLEKLSSDLQNIRMETGATAEGIASAVTTAGSIGIPTDELAGFTEVAMQMGSAFSMSAESASEAMGKIGNVVKPAEMSWTEFATKAGSSVNALADSMATSETEILTGMTHLGAVMGLLKPPADTLPAWQAMVATIQSLGLAGDQAGEAIQDALMYATKDAKGGISGLLGMTGEELQLNLRTNAPEVMQQAAEAIASLPLEEQGEALAAFGSTGSKAIALLMGDLDPASGKFTKLGEAIETSNSAWIEGAGLAEAFEKSQQTVNVAIDRLSATLDVAGQKMGTGLLPAVAEGINFLTDFVTIAIKVGETLDDWGVDEALGKVWDLTPLGMMQDSEALQGAWADAKAWAGIGEEIGDETAKGIDNSDLPKAPGKALSSPDALAATGDAAKEAAKKYANDFQEAAGIFKLSDMEWLKMTNGQETAYNESFDRIFDHAGKSLRMHLSDGGSGNFWSLFSGDTLLGQSFGGDAVAAFQAITGLPAPEEGAAAYYRLVGDAAEAEKIELQQRLLADPVDLYTGEEQAAFKTQNEEIWSNFGESTAQIISDNFDYIGKSGSDDAKEAMDIILDAFAHPDATKFNAVSAALEGAKGSMLDSSQADRLAEEFKAKILPQITDIKAFCQTQGEEMGSTITDAFSDSVLSEDERALIVAMEPMLDMLEKEAPDAFRKSGLDGISAFIDAVKSGASSSELASMWATISGAAKDAGVAAGEALAKGLMEGSGRFFGDFQNQVHDWTEYVNSEGGFVGPTEYYDEYYAQKAGQQIRALEALQNVEDIKVALSIDTETAKTTLKQFYEDQNGETGKSELEKTLDIDDVQAKTDIAAVDTAATATMIKPLQIDSTQAFAEIAAIDTAASAPVTKTVYIRNVGSTTGASYNDMGIPAFGRGDVFVSRPTLAIVGDRPGGEWIGGADQARARFGQSAGVTVNYSPVINGSGLSPDALSRVLARNNSELIEKLAHLMNKDLY